MSPIAEMLNQIKNGQAALKESVVFPFSNLKLNLLKVLQDHGLIEGVEQHGRARAKGAKKNLEVFLKYQNKKGVISGLKMVSKPSQRIYVSRKEIPRIKGGSGLAVISTPRGLMTDREARRKGLGGEVICEIW
jgi:small subunit ribosomal protein S8